MTQPNQPPLTRAEIERIANDPWSAVSDLEAVRQLVEALLAMDDALVDSIWLIRLLDTDVDRLRGKRTRELQADWDSRLAALEAARLVREGVRKA